MTSEVIIMNKKAAVIAADSAITVTSRNQSQEKYYKNANKIFEGSFENPIAIMFFDNVEINGFPWEILIKLFRDSIGGKKYQSLDLYVIDLICYIESLGNIFTEQYNYEIFQDLFLPFMEIFSEKIKKESAEAQVYSGKDISNSNIEVFLKNKKEIEGIKIPENLEYLITSEEAKKAISIFIGVVSSEEIITGVNNDDFLRLSFEAFSRQYLQYSTHTGIVICGFGTDDFFPQTIKIDIHGMLFGKLIYDEIKKEEISISNPSHIESFAMDDMANTFMYGMGATTRKSLLVNFIQCIDELKEEVVQKGAIISDESEFIKKYFFKFNDFLVNDRANNHFSPLRMAIGSLAPDEMANLAETLISLESLKERVTRPSESVGGPIDIAVLTKAEGLVWVQRKHYFPSDLNMRYAERQRRKMK